MYWLTKKDMEVIVTTIGVTNNILNKQIYTANGSSVILRNLPTGWNSAAVVT